MSNPADAYLNNILYILQSPIIYALQRLPKISPYRAVVVGGRALNMYLQRDYQLTSFDWDINVWNSEDPTDQSALSSVGEYINKEVNLFINMHKDRFEYLDTYFNTHLEDVFFTINPNPFHTSQGKIYYIGHIDVNSTRFGYDSLMDVVENYFAPSEYISIDGINFLNPVSIVQELQYLISVPTYKKKERAIQKLRLFRQALASHGLSCNYYRREFKNLPNTITAGNLQHCIDETIMGVPDTILGPIRRKRFYVSKADLSRHNRYYHQLPNRSKRLVLQYTGNLSAEMNLEVFNYLTNPSTLLLPERDAALQQMILQAPPLTKDMVVFKVARFMILGDHTNYELSINDTEPQYMFNSTSCDNWLNFGPYMDEFQVCCAFRIHIAAGNHILIVDGNSSFPQESEVILPFGCLLKIVGKKTANVTFAGTTPNDVIYDDMTVYDCEYIPPEKIVTKPKYVDMTSVTQYKKKKYGGPIPIYKMPFEDHFQQLFGSMFGQL